MYSGNSSSQLRHTRVIVLEADLELDGLEEVSLLGVEGVIEELLDLGTHSGYCNGLAFSSEPKKETFKVLTDCDFRHVDSLPVDIL